MNELHEQIASLNMQDYIHFLGYIPKIDQISLMKQALGVIQPTRYEGSPGGGVVEDAVSLGQQAVVSDISVNREINDASVLFFHTGDAQDLAEKMEQAIRRGWKIPSPEEIGEQGKQRQRLYYQVLKNMIDQTASK